MERNNNIVLVDTFAIGTFHEMFNAAFLSSVADISNHIDYYGTHSSIENQKQMISKKILSKITYHYVHQIRLKGVLWLLFRYIYAAISTLYVISKNKGSKIVILNNNPFFSIFFHYIKTDITIVCHGEMELILPGKYGKFGSIQHKILKKVFYNQQIPPNISFIVLGQSILDNLRKIIPQENAALFSSIEHPYIFKSSYDYIIKKKNDKCEIKIGVVGITTPSKGLDYLQKLLSLNFKRIKIYHIGKISDKDGNLRSKGLHIVKRDSKNELSRDVYEKWIDQMDFLLFLYPENNYRLTASGAIFECLLNNKPAIALRNDYFNYLSDCIGDFGYLFSSVEELSSYMSKLDNDEVMMKSFNEVLANGRQKFSIKSVARQLKLLF